MKIVEKKNSIVVKYSKTKDKGITWRKDKKFCEEKMKEMDNSKEYEEIIAIKKTIMATDSQG